MNITTLRVALGTSLLVNVGVVIAVVMTMFRPPATAAGLQPLPEYLNLDTTQAQRWHELEQPFMAQFGATSSQIETHRVALVNAIFADTVDRQRLEAERAAIADLQAEQQRLLIEQLLAEREVLNSNQRLRLEHLLLEQGAAPSPVERMHSR